MELHTSETIGDTSNTSTNNELSLSFDIDNGGTETVYVEDKLLTNFAVAEARAKSILAEDAYLTKRVSFSTYHIDNLHIGDTIELDTLSFKVISIVEKIKGAVVSMDITADKIMLPPPPPPFDLTLTTFDVAYNLDPQETTPYDVTFSSDGTKMFIVGNDTDKVHQYNLGVAWSVTSAVYNSSFSVATQETIPYGVTFSSDGTKMFIVGIIGDKVHQYNLGVAWSVTSAVYNSFFSVATQETFPYDVTFSSDGTKMFIVGKGSIVYQYNLTTAWSVTSAVYNSSFSVAIQVTRATSVAFSSDGTKMFIVDNGGVSRVNQYNLGTAWLVTSAVYNSFFSLMIQDSNPYGMALSSDGTKMFVVGEDYNRVYQYNLFGVM